MELFILPPDVVAGPDKAQARSTIRMEEFRESPHGFWYPTLIHQTNQFAPTPTPPKTATEPGRGVQAHQQTTSTRYYLDFNAELTDSMFTTDDAR